MNHRTMLLGQLCLLVLSGCTRSRSESATADEGRQAGSHAPTCSIYLAPSEHVSVQEGDSVVLEARIGGCRGENPDSVVWSSSAPNAVAVNARGKLTAVVQGLSPGRAEITAAAVGWWHDVKTTLPILVRPR